MTLPKPGRIYPDRETAKEMREAEDAWREQAHFWEARAALLTERVSVLEGALEKIVKFAEPAFPLSSQPWIELARAALRTSEGK
jgi:hypothetical protein